MLTREQIRKNLLENEFWVPSENITNEEWALFDEVYDEMEQAGELGANNANTTNEDDNNDSGNDWDNDDDDDDDWDE